MRFLQLLRWIREDGENEMTQQFNRGYALGAFNYGTWEYVYAMNVINARLKGVSA